MFFLITNVSISLYSKIVLHDFFMMGKTYID